VFPGRYVSCSAVLAQRLLPHLDSEGALGPHANEWSPHANEWMIFAKPLEAALADTATVH
jgi:hypothetical protein